VNLVDHLYLWTDRVLFFGLLALRAWAVIDCLTRTASAFAAANKLTKPAWLAILVVAGLIGSLPSIAQTWFLPLVTVVVASVYLADVRPAVREAAGGQRW
jgi:hypothetical protein